MFAGHEQDVIHILWAALALLAVTLVASWRWQVGREGKRLDNKFEEQAKQAGRRADELAVETRKNAQELADTTKTNAQLLADEAKSREDELSAFRDRIWEELRGLREAIHETSKRVEVSNATIRGNLDTLASSMDLRVKAMELVVDSRLQAFEKKLPNGQLERLASSFESIVKRISVLEDRKSRSGAK